MLRTCLDLVCPATVLPMVVITGILYVTEVDDEDPATVNPRSVVLCRE